MRVDPTGKLKTDYQISAPEKELADNKSTNEQETWEEECGGDPECGGQASGGSGWAPNSPILLDLDGDGFRLTSIAGGVEFDIDADFWVEEVAWTAPGSGDGFLYHLRRHERGPIHGGQFFGNHRKSLFTFEKVAHGYEALLEWDRTDLGGNANLKIDPGDAVFDELGVWVDSNHDGVAQAEELSALSDHGVYEISLEYHETAGRDRNGNEFRYRSQGWRTDVLGRKRPVAVTDVFLQTGAQTVLRRPTPPPHVDIDSP